METVKIMTIVAIATVLAVAAGVATMSASVLAQSSPTKANFGQCQKAQIERFGTHDFAHDFCKGVP